MIVGRGSFWFSFWCLSIGRDTVFEYRTMRGLEVAGDETTSCIYRIYEIKTRSSNNTNTIL